MGDYVGDGCNDYGSPVSLHVCPECGKEFTCCPPYKGHFGGCLGRECSSYDPDRDVDRLFEPGGDTSKIVRLPNQWPPHDGSVDEEAERG